MTFTSSPALVGRIVAALTERRKLLKLSQEDVDAKVGWERLTGKYEAGIRVPSIQALTFWADSLGCQIGLLTDPQSELGARDLKKAAALVHLSNGRGIRQTARMLSLPHQTVAEWRAAVCRSVRPRCAVRGPRSGAIQAA